MSFDLVLKPTLETLLVDCNLENVLDVGCGTGVLTEHLFSRSEKITGIDLSSVSIKIAEETCSGIANISFHNCSAEDLANQSKVPRFTTVVANMVLMDCLDLNSFVEAAASLTVPGGHFIATITHPWFWPIYWGYAEADWFNYHREIVIEAPFRISTEITDRVTTHVHRPLHKYQNCLTSLGFIVDEILEPLPDEEVHSLYPDKWRFPRFLAFRASLVQ